MVAGLSPLAFLQSRLFELVYCSILTEIFIGVVIIIEGSNTFWVRGNLNETALLAGYGVQYSFNMRLF